MTLKSGTNRLWPTTIKKSEFCVTEDMLSSALQKQVHPSIETLALALFDDYLQAELNMSLTQYNSQNSLVGSIATKIPA